MNQPSGRQKVEPVAVHADAALADEVAALIFEIVLPDMLAGARVDREDVVGDGEVQNAVHQQRRGLDGRTADAALRTDAGDAVHPLDLQQIDVGLVDLVEIAEAPARVIAVIRRPDVGGRLKSVSVFGSRPCARASAAKKIDERMQSER